MCKLLISAIIFVLYPIQCAVASGPTPKGIDSVFADYDKSGTPGCALGVYRDGEITYARGYGMANLEHDIPLTPDSVFRMASTSKQFVATAVALLDEAGQLDLDDPIRKYFPDMPDYGDKVTLRQLIHHTSGVRDYLDLADLADLGITYSTEEALSLILTQKQLNFEPGSDYLYSNSGYLLLGQVVEKVTGQPLREWSREHIFEPLGMKNTHFHDDHTHIVRGRADGYSMGEENGWHISMTQLDMVGDGGLYSTIRDLQRWNDNFAQNRLGKERKALIQTLETPGQLKSGKPLDYAFGLFVEDFYDTREVSHGGSFVGFRTEIARYPEIDLGLAVLCNRADADPRTLARQVAALYLDASASGLSKAGLSEQALSESPAATANVPVAAEKLRQHVGHYWYEGNIMLQGSVIREAGGYYFDLSVGERLKLQPMSEDRFQTTMFGSRATLSLADNNMTLSVQGWPELLLQRYEPDTPDADTLEALAGNYYSPELDHYQRIQLIEGQLIARRRSGEKQLRPLPGNRFILDRALVKFERAADGSITAFTVSTGRVQNVKYKRI